MKTGKIKILHIIKSLGRGGAEMLLPETLRLHDTESFEFHYGYFLPWKNQMVESIENFGGKVVCFNASNNIILLTKIWQVARYVRQNEIVLIHAHLPWAGILARLVGKLVNVPVVYTEHNKQERYHRATRFMNLLTMDLLRMVIAVSKDVEVSVRRYKPRLKPAIRTILNGVNAEEFVKEKFDRQDKRDLLGIPSGSLIVGTIAVFRFQKRLDVWMELAANILKKNSLVHFVIVGDGPLKDDLIKKRDALGLNDRIHMPGLEKEVRPWLATFDIYMMCSVFEGLPIALLEGMSMGCAVISTDAGGIKEVIRHEIDGLLCPVNQPGELAEYACMLLQNEHLRVAYGKKARNRVIEQFSLKTMVAELEQVYIEILGLPNNE